MSHTFANLTPPPSGAFETICVTLIVEHGLVDFFLRVEDEWTVLDNFLIEWKAGDEDYK